MLSPVVQRLTTITGLLPSPRTSTLLCQRWVEVGFMEMTDPAKKSRRYKLNDAYEAIIDEIE